MTSNSISSKSKRKFKRRRSSLTSKTIPNFSHAHKSTERVQGSWKIGKSIWWHSERQQIKQRTLIADYIISIKIRCRSCSICRIHIIPNLQWKKWNLKLTSLHRDTGILQRLRMRSIRMQREGKNNRRRESKKLRKNKNSTYNRVSHLLEWITLDMRCRNSRRTTIMHAG